ncbi:MAG TPA: HAMP domain-containing sensor histidine kinase [Xanthomonadales bacterium]|nr:HAMP domain-containing sensor histidine kinase [Xanthomonadales bacterium]
MNAATTTTPEPAATRELALLGEFAAAATHFLASPIGALLANVEVGTALLERPDAATRLPDVFQRLRAECLRCQLLLARLREFVNALDELGFEHEVDLATVCREGLDAAVGAGACGPEQTELVEYDPPPPARRLPRAALVRVIEGLVHNAAQAGASNIHVSLAHDAHASLVCVRDDGPGIPTAILPRVTQPFFRAGKSDTLGLGLWFANEVATRCGGTLSVENHPGGGCVVCLRLPLQGPGN